MLEQPGDVDRAGVDGEREQTTHRAKCRCVSDAESRKILKAGVQAKQASLLHAWCTHGKFASMAAAADSWIFAPHSADWGECPHPRR